MHIGSRFAVIIFVLLLPFSALACSCFAPDGGSFEDEIAAHDAVFTAVIVATEKLEDGAHPYQLTEVRVAKVWKGKRLTHTAFIKTEIEQSSCGGEAPTVGALYLIYATEFELERYSTGGCSTFMNLDAVAAELKTVSAEERAEWKARFAELWATLGEPNVVFEQP